MKRLWLKAVTGPDSAEATENTEWVRTEFTENYGKLRSSDTGFWPRYRFELVCYESNVIKLFLYLLKSNVFSV